MRNGNRINSAWVLGAAAAAALLGFASGARPAGAAVTSVEFTSGDSIENTGVTFDGTISYDSVSKLLSVDLANTSSFQSVITGFFFNIAGSATADYNAADDAATAGVDESAFANNLTLSPFGTWDAGVLLQNLSQQQVRGIDEGEAGRFTFDLTGAGAGDLAAIDFITDENSGGGLSGAFAVRYQSVGDNAEMSDKVLGVVITPPPTAIPLPPAAWAGLATMGMIGLGHLRGRLRRPQA